MDPIEERRKNGAGGSHMSATLDWLLKRYPVKLIAQNKDGKDVVIQYDHSAQQFKIGGK